MKRRTWVKAILSAAIIAAGLGTTQAKADEPVVLKSRRADRRCSDH